ncbi:MAG: hypothetical protein A2V88_09245 [Elusimicrobia bacterium RBG_16_66_12]|nr:MAG: hypothetical protein A2V88_09245 [Elusimicrobia bacterium RBG_16_66_12]
MISNINPIVTAAVVGLAVVLTAFMAPTRRQAPTGQLSGVIYSIEQDTAAVKAAASAMPEIDVGLDPAARALLPPAQGLFVRFVGIDKSTFTLTLALRLLEASSRPVLEAPKPPAAKLVTRKARPKKVEPAAPAVSAALQAVPTPAPATAAQEETPTFPIGFAEIDEALRASSTAKAINVREKKGGVSFRLTHVGRVGERYVVRFAIANEESSDFFLSITKVLAGGRPVHSEAVGPYSCSASKEIFGVVHFLPSAVAGKKVAVELVQSGGDHRRFRLDVDFVF